MIQFDASLLVIMVIFWATFFVARKLIFLPVSQLLEERARNVATAQETYSTALAKSEAELEEQKQKLAGALGEARTRRDELRKAAQEQRTELVRTAKAAADSELQKARGDLDEAVTQQRDALGQFVEKLADKMASTLLRRAS